MPETDLDPTRKKKEMNDNLKITDQKIDEVLGHLEEAFEIFHLEIEPTINTSQVSVPDLEPRESNILNSFYVDGMSYEDIADYRSETVRQIYDLRESGLEKLAQYIGRSISQTEYLLRLGGLIHNHCSPEVIDQFRTQFNT